MLCAPPPPLPSTTALVSSFLSLWSAFSLTFSPKFLQKNVLLYLVKTFFAAQTTKKIASKVCRMPRSSDRLARSLSAFEYLSSTRPAAAVFSNNFSSQAKWFHPSSSRPLHCCLPTLHCHCDSKCQIKYCSLPQHNRYRSRGRRLVFARAQVNKCTCTLAQHSRDQ